MSDVFRLKSLVLALLSLVLTSGCNMLWRRTLPDPEKSQVIRVEKGERLYFDLAEDFRSGSCWFFTCDDRDVEVTVDHDEVSRADVRIRIHRGYDGPSAIHFFYKRKGGPIEKEFTISLFRHTGDRAFWK